MRGLTLLYFLLSAVLIYAHDVTPESVEEAFVQAGIVPDVLSSFEPVLLLDVTYTIPETGVKKSVTPPGKNFTETQTLNSPTYSIPDAEYSQYLHNETFVVAMVDPDAPTPQNPTLSQIRHFLGGNFHLQGSDYECGGVLVNSTPALSEYIQPAPPNTSDPHRYTWLLYRQPLDFPTTLNTSLAFFNISAFARQFDLGEPLAGNFMTVSTNPAALAAAGEY